MITNLSLSLSLNSYILNGKLSLFYHDDHYNFWLLLQSRWLRWYKEDERWEINQLYVTWHTIIIIICWFNNYHQWWCLFASLDLLIFLFIDDDCDDDDDRDKIRFNRKWKNLLMKMIRKGKSFFSLFSQFNHHHLNRKQINQNFLHLHQ